MRTLTVDGNGKEFQLDIADGQLVGVRYEETLGRSETIPLVPDGGDWLGETVLIPTWLLVFLADGDFTEEGQDDA